MPIRIRCNACGSSLDVGSKHAGKTIDCPGCGAPVKVVAADAGPREKPAPIMPRRIDEDEDSDRRPAGGTLDSKERYSPEFPAVGNDDRANQRPFDGEFATAPDSVLDEAEQSANATLPPRRSGPPKPDMGGFNMGKKRPVDQEEMDLTPMVDMTFLLLIFFMITASFSVQKSIEVPPPSNDKKGASQSIQSIDDLVDSSINVRIDEKNVVFIEDEPVGAAVRLSDALLRQFSAQKNELLLSADEQALHDTVVAVIDAANEIGVQKIRMVAQAKD